MTSATTYTWVRWQLLSRDTISKGCNTSLPFITIMGLCRFSANDRTWLYFFLFAVVIKISIFHLLQRDSIIYCSCRDLQIIGTGVFSAYQVISTKATFFNCQVVVVIDSCELRLNCLLKGFIVTGKWNRKANFKKININILQCVSNSKIRFLTVFTRILPICLYISLGLYIIHLCHRISSA